MEDFSSYLDEFTSAKRYKGLRDYHLRSALTTASLSSSTLIAEAASLRRDVIVLEENYRIVSRDPASILGEILLKSPLLPSYGPDLYHAGHSLATESLLYTSIPTPFYRYAAEKLMGESMETKYLMPSLFFQRAIVVANAINAKKQLPEYIMQTQADMAAGMVTMRLGSLNITLKILSECFGVILGDDNLSIHDLNHLRNWSDKCTERYNVELACIFGNHLNPIIYPHISMMYSFWDLWDGKLSELGNSMYKCVKVFEAMVIGVLLQKNPNQNIIPLHDFLNTTINDYCRENQGRCPRSCEALLSMKDFLLTDISSQHLAQLYGLYRTWGHPVVSPKEGMEKVMKLGLAPKQVSEIIPKMIRRVFMTRYSEWFKSSKGTYPAIDSNVSNIEGNKVREILIQGGSTEELRQYTSSPCWDEIRFRKNIEIPKTFNLSEMVADKAVSPDRSALLMLCKRSRGGLYDANYRRGVLQWLLRDPESCADFLERIDSDGLVEDEMIIGLYQKERELNEKPRMFALMSHSMRNYIVTTESMLSEDILPAFPSITMTNSLLSLQKKIYSVSYQQAKNTSGGNFQTYKDVTIIVNIDFEKWNLNFRRETTYPLFEALGDLYGLEMLYNRTYDIFEQSLIYLADGSYRPVVSDDGNGFVLEPPYSYIGHRGGFEGLRQKGWTLFTDCGLDLVCSRHKCSFQIMGQGDNQVLILTWKTYMLDGDRNITAEGRAQLTAQFNSLMRDLVQTFGELGLPVKALETWSSENLFLYGKFPTLHGVPLAMSLKKLCRAYYLANEEIMSLDCALATIQSNAMAACMADVTSHVPYVIYKIQAMMALSAYSDYHVLIGKGAFTCQSESKWRFSTSAGLRWEFPVGVGLGKWKFLLILSWFPKILGGLNIATWFDFLMRGFPDKVSQAFTWIRMLLGVVTDESMRHSLETIYQTHINPEKNFVLLVEDPCALNLVVPVDARASMKQAVQELFENLQNVRNEEFATLFKYNREWKKDAMCNSLCRADILHPRFLHDLVAASPGGYIDSVVSKVSKASTINKAALKSSAKNPGDKIERHEENMMRYLVWKLSPGNQYRSYISNICPTQQARELRLRSWDKILEGVTVPFPLAFLEFKECMADRVHKASCDLNFISVTLPEIFCNGDLSSIHTLGAAPPYLGSETKEKVSGDVNRQVFGKEPLISRPLKLLRVINWFVPGESHSAQLIKSLLRAVSNLNPEEYISREMGITGSEAHRYRDQALKHGVMSSNMYTLGSHMHISTDPWIKYTRGAENYTINYQAILCSLQALIGEYIFWCCSENIAPSREYHFHESCNLCIAPLTEEFHDLMDNSAESLVISGEGNQYLWVEESSLYFKYKDDPVLNLGIEELTDRDYSEMRDKRGILTSWIANDVCADLSRADNRKELRMLDSRDYPRVLYKKLAVGELWEEIAKTLIASAGVRYSAGESSRVAYLSSARELAADDLMKTSSQTLMGASMFYTWEEKFREIHLYDSSSVFPDSNPPTLEGACLATQINMREIVRRVKMDAPASLVIPRSSRDPVSYIKSFWYRIMMSDGSGCPQCLKSMSQMEISNLSQISVNIKCELGHQVISARMKNISSLAASEDRLLKDCEPYGCDTRNRIYNRCTHKSVSPGLSVIFDSAELYETGNNLPHREAIWLQNETWVPAISLPTSSYTRVHEMISVLRLLGEELNVSTGSIFGDGLGDSSSILSLYWPNTNWTVISLQDSERAIPQSYPHLLIPRNPMPSERIDYRSTKALYNDVMSVHFEERWKDWIEGGICWYEVEAKGNEYQAVRKIVFMREWEACIGRVELGIMELHRFVNEVNARYDRVILVLCGSLNTKKHEIMFYLRGSCSKQQIKPSLCGEWLRERCERGCDELYMKTGSLIYAEYIASLETTDEISQMLRRCDHWFAQVGLTHLLGCKDLFTALWWDLQTGKIPSRVKDLGVNKTYFLYRSDMVALQARLLALSISLLRHNPDVTEELSRLHNWKMDISYKDKSLNIRLIKGETKGYGPAETMIGKFIPVLRKLNRMHNRWWSEMPGKIEFTTNKRVNGLWISKMAMLTPSSLPDIE